MGAANDAKATLRKHTNIHLNVINNGRSIMIGRDSYLLRASLKKQSRLISKCLLEIGVMCLRWSDMPGLRSREGTTTSPSGYWMMPVILLPTIRKCIMDEPWHMSRWENWRKKLMPAWTGCIGNGRTRGDEIFRICLLSSHEMWTTRSHAFRKGLMAVPSAKSGNTPETRFTSTSSIPTKIKIRISALAGVWLMTIAVSFISDMINL